jgi:SAM-dependent methyltransferase
VPALDYAQIADLYDAYCVFDADIPYFVNAAKGDVLELMAGTGRISSALLRAGAALTCVEYVPSMLRVLAAKHPAARAIAADVCALPFASRSFDTVLLPFQGLSELCEGGEALMTEVARTLRPGGRFVCTAHNPAARRATLDGEWRRFGSFPHPDGTVELSVRGSVDGQIATGEQRVVLRDATGAVVRDHLLPLRFSLPPLEVINAMAAGAGLRLESVHGDYDRALYEPQTSRAIVASYLSSPLAV